MHPIQIDIDYVERQSRLTTLFRYFLVIPHNIVANLWGIAAWVISFFAWFAILFTGRYPEGMWRFTAGWLRYQGRVACFAALLADGFPPFSGDGDYPVRVRTERQERMSRLTTFFRFIMLIPAYVILLLAQIAAAVVVVVLWLAIVFTGRAPRGMHGFVAKVQRYSLRFTAYALYLTDRYPNFESAPASGPTGAGETTTTADW